MLRAVHEETYEHFFFIFGGCTILDVFAGLGAWIYNVTCYGLLHPMAPIIYMLSVIVEVYTALS